MKASAGSYRTATAQLRDLRKRRNLRLRDVADATGVSRQFLGLVERGVQGASTDLQAALADVFGVAVAELFEDADAEAVDLAALAETFLAEAGACGSPGCADNECGVPPGMCHRAGCTNRAAIATQTVRKPRAVKGAPRLYCGRSCSTAAVRARRDEHRAAGELTTAEAACRLDRSPVVIARLAREKLVGPALGERRSVGSRDPELGPQGGQYFFTEDDVRLLEAHVKAASRLHNDPKRHGAWHLARHKNTTGYGRKAKEIAEGRGKKVGPKARLAPETVADIERLHQARLEGDTRWSQQGIAEYLSRKGTSVSRKQVRRIVESYVERTEK